MQIDKEKLNRKYRQHEDFYKVNILLVLAVILLLFFVFQISKSVEDPQTQISGKITKIEKDGDDGNPDNPAWLTIQADNGKEYYIEYYCGYRKEGFLARVEISLETGLEVIAQGKEIAPRKLTLCQNADKQFLKPAKQS